MNEGKGHFYRMVINMYMSSNSDICEQCCPRCQRALNVDHWSVTECDMIHPPYDLCRNH